MSAPTSPARTPIGTASLLLLAWPIIIARATQSVVGFCDAWMVAPLGADALAATTTGAVDTFAALMLPFGTVFILQSFAAQLRGAGRVAEALAFARLGLVLAVLAGLVAAALIPLVPAFAAAVAPSPNVARLMATFIAIRLLSVGPAVAVEAIGNWYGGFGRPEMSLYAGLVVMTSNVALNFLLIPSLGVAGSAWASTIASLLGALTMLALLVLRVGLPRDVMPAPSKVRDLWRVLRFGLPNGANWFLEFGAFALFINLLVGGLGTTTLAAFNVVMQINSVAFMPAFGLASAGAILVGERIGSGEPDAVPRIVWITGRTAALWMVAVGVLYWLFPAIVVAPFQSPGEAGLAALAATMLAWSLSWQAADAVGMTLSEALRAAGDTTWTMVVRVFLAWALFLPGAAIAMRLGGLGIVGAMGAMTAYISLLALLFFLRFRSNAWRRIQLVEPSVVDDVDEPPQGNAAAALPGQ